MTNGKMIEESLHMGDTNLKTLALARNWCAFLNIESLSAPGLIEETTGLPTGLKRFRCEHALPGNSSPNLEHILLDFYESNCKACGKRVPVGKPDVVQLVENRDSEKRKRKEHLSRIQQQQTAAIAARISRREELRKGLDPELHGIFDIIDQVDRARSTDAALMLEKAVVLLRDRIGASILESLRELIRESNSTAAKAALRALRAVENDSVKLGEAALEAMARDIDVEYAGTIITEFLDLTHDSLIDAVLPQLVHLVWVEREIDVAYVVSSSDPRPLIKTYSLFGERVRRGLSGLLKKTEKFPRIGACKAIQCIVPLDPDFGISMTQELIASLDLPDEDYGMDGPASFAVVEALAETMKVRPNELDRIIQNHIEVADRERRVMLFRTYTLAIQPPPDHSLPIIDPAHEVAFRRIVSAFIERADSEILDQASECLGHVSMFYPDLIKEKSESLLGAVALLAEDCSNPNFYSTLLDPSPSLDPLKVWEMENRRMTLERALRVVAEVLGNAAARNPDSVGESVIQTLDRLTTRQEILKAALVSGLGRMVNNPIGIKTAVPTLYSALNDSSPVVRSAAAKAYGTITPGAAKDLPPLLHETFLLLLLDPYTAVHRAAIYALREVIPLPEYRPKAAALIRNLVRVYVNTDPTDNFIEECFARLFAVCRGDESVCDDATKELFEALRHLEKSVAIRLVRSYRWKLRGLPGYVDFLVQLVSDGSPSLRELDDLLEELRNGAPEEIARFASKLRLAAERFSSIEPTLADDFLEILTLAGEWTGAVELARKEALRIGKSRWEQYERSYRSMRQIAAEIEGAISQGQINGALESIKKWKEMRQ
jgi:hypothetical protein